MIMPHQVELRRLTSGDEDAVARLHRVAVPESERDMTVSGSPKLAAYVAALVALPEYRGEHVFTGAFRGGELVGYTHARLLPGRWHLNYVAVRPTCQGEGVGRALWAAWLRDGREWGLEVASLDVLPKNTRVADWYRRRGLAEVATTWTCFADGAPADQPASGGQPDAKIAGWEEAEAWQRAYGFSRFKIEWGGGTWDVGRLPARYFSVAAEFPAALHGVLRAVDPKRAVVFTTHDKQRTQGFNVARVSVRMEAALSQVV